MATRPVNDRLLDASVAHEIAMQRYTNGVVRRMSALLNRTDADIFTRLTQALESLPPEAFTVQRLEQFLVSVRDLNLQAYNALQRAMGSEIRTIIENELEFQQTLIERVVPKAAFAAVDLNEVAAEQLYAASMARPFQGRLLSEWASGLETQRMHRVRDTLRIGYVAQETVAQMVARLRGTRASGYSDGILSIDRRNAEAVVRTAISHTAQFARQEFYKENPDLISKVQWISTLDNRTTTMCMLRDRKQYEADEKHKPIGHKLPWAGGPGALHWNCRSTSAPVVKSWREMGLDIEEFTPTERAAMDGATAGATTYAQWLGRQSAAMHDDILGPTRGALFRRGGLPLERFANDKGKWLTLSQLKARDAQAFERAGVEE